MNQDEKATNYETLAHIHLVGHNIHKVVKHLLDRADKHDASKLVDPELQSFVEVTPVLKGLTYGSEEYRANLERIRPALTHHYANNRHHPQHFKNGIEDMTLLDIVEMFCDWAAAGKRHEDGNLHTSIEINAGRFNICPQLVKIFENTVGVLEE